MKGLENQNNESAFSAPSYQKRSSFLRKQESHGA
jgi:hypothetical protein